MFPTSPNTPIRPLSGSEQIEELVALYLGGAQRDRLDPILDACVATYNNELDEDGQVDFKGKAKAFTRTYDFLASILPYTHAAWEKLSIFLNFLIPKLPAPKEEDLSKGVLDEIDMDSYRVEKRASMTIQMADADAEIEPVLMTGDGSVAEPGIDYLSNILKTFNDQFGNIAWKDAEWMERLITREIPAKVAADVAYQNAKRHSDKQNARIEHDRASGARHRKFDERRYGTVQAVSGQRGVPSSGDGHGVWADVRRRNRNLTHWPVRPLEDLRQI